MQTVENASRRPRLRRRKERLVECYQASFIEGDFGEPLNGAPVSALAPGASLDRDGYACENPVWRNRFLPCLPVPRRFAAFVFSTRPCGPRCLCEKNRPPKRGVRACPVASSGVREAGHR